MKVVDRQKFSQNSEVSKPYKPRCFQQRLRWIPRNLEKLRKLHIFHEKHKNSLSSYTVLQPSVPHVIIHSGRRVCRKWRSPKDPFFPQSLYQSFHSPAACIKPSSKTFSNKNQLLYITFLSAATHFTPPVSWCIRSSYRPPQKLQNMENWDAKRSFSKFFKWREPVLFKKTSRTQLPTFLENKACIHCSYAIKYSAVVVYPHERYNLQPPWSLPSV